MLTAGGGAGFAFGDKALMAESETESVEHFDEILEQRASFPNYELHDLAGEPAGRDDVSLAARDDLTSSTADMFKAIRSGQRRMLDVAETVRDNGAACSADDGVPGAWLGVKLLCASLAAVVAAVGCSSSTTPAPSPPSSAAPSAGPTETADQGLTGTTTQPTSRLLEVDPCSLITPQQLDELGLRSISASKMINPQERVCDYLSRDDPDGLTLFLSVSDSLDGYRSPAADKEISESSIGGRPAVTVLQTKLAGCTVAIGLGGGDVLSVTNTAAFDLPADQYCPRATDTARYAADTLPL